MMTGIPPPGADGPLGFLLAIGGGQPGSHGGRGLAIAAMVSWLAAESLGVYMLRNWIASSHRDRPAAPAGLSPALIYAHACLAFAGLVSWTCFLLTGSAVPAWLAIGLLGPAIGLGISTVTVWTPYPARRPVSARAASSDGRHAISAVLATDDMLNRALASEAMTSKLVDDLVDRMLAGPPPTPRPRRSWQLAPVIPVLHGAAALTTFLLATLAAITA